jgi:hypothetical protein
LAPAIVMAIAILLIFTSCYKNYDLGTTDYDVVVTDYDPAKDFQAKPSPDFTMPTEIINAADPDGPPIDIDNPSYDEDDILSYIQTKLTGLGYNPVASGAARDFAVIVAGAESDYFYYYSGCWPYYGYYYCWDYPYYGGGYYDYAFTAGSLIIQLVDTDGNPPPPPGTNEDAELVWLAGINGIEDSYLESYAETRIEGLIDQAFAQSPYLDPTP